MSMCEPTKLLIVDDEVDLLEILDTWFTARGFDVVTAPEAVDAIALVKSRRFDVAIIDLQLPGISGLQLQTMLREVDPVMPVIFMSGHGTMDDAIAALREGRAFDFLRKPLQSLHQLSLVVAKVLAATKGLVPSGDMRIPPVPTDLKPTYAPKVPSGVDMLTSREREILQTLAQGLSNRQIAAHLVVSEKTIKNHLSQIFSKLQVDNRTQAALYLTALDLQFVPST